jgi:broad specificity phosphatase PhoE
MPEVLLNCRRWSAQAEGLCHKTLYLVRHGEPTLTGVLLGRNDPGLSPAGHESARACLAGLQGAIAYVSPLRRARETAEYLDAAIPRGIVPELAEVCLGEWEGLRWTEVEARYPDMARRKAERWFDVTPPGGETWDEIRARAEQALAIATSGPSPAIVVAHQGINSVIAHLLAGIACLSYSQAYCQIIRYEF